MACVYSARSAVLPQEEDAHAADADMHAQHGADLQHTSGIAQGPGYAATRSPPQSYRFDLKDEQRSD